MSAVRNQHTIFCFPSSIPFEMTSQAVSLCMIAHTRGRGKKKRQRSFERDFPDHDNSSDARDAVCDYDRLQSQCLGLPLLFVLAGGISSSQPSCDDHCDKTRDTAKDVIACNNCQIIHMSKPDLFTETSFVGAARNTCSLTVPIILIIHVRPGNYHIFSRLAKRYCSC